MRMTSISAILVRHQLRNIEEKIRLFNRNWWILYNSIDKYYFKSKKMEHEVRIDVAPRLPDEEIVGTSFLFNVTIHSARNIGAYEEQYETLEKFC